MPSLLNKLENWLDKKLNKLNREHQFLKRSDSKWHRWMWKVCFKPSRKTLDLIVNSPPVQAFIPRKKRRVIHVVNLILPRQLKNRNLAQRVELTLESIEEAQTKEVILLGCVSNNIARKGWKTHKLTRTATSELKNPIDTAYLKDMLTAASSIAKEGDIIFYSNLDCPVHPRIYNNLLSNPSPITEFIRRDIAPVQDYEDIFSQPFTHYEIGVDGLAFTKEALEQALPLLPDFVIGEPHWDTAVSGILKQSHGVEQNTTDLYHLIHPQQWDDDSLSPGGKHNKILYRRAVEYGLMEDSLISLQKDCALVLLKDKLTSSITPNLIKNLRNLSFLNNKVESVFCEYVKGESKAKTHINHIGYLPIRAPNPSTEKLNQKNAILNLLKHYFGNYKHIIILAEHAKPITLQQINQIKDQLQSTNKIIRKDYVALAASAPLFDFYIENKQKFSNIERVSFINDDGLLELIETYGYF